MSDLGDYWRAARAESAKRRANNREKSAEILSEHGIEFEVKNGGAHIIVKGVDCLIDFWPGTGKFITRNGDLGRGVRNLLKLCVQHTLDRNPSAGREE